MPQEEHCSSRLRQFPAAGEQPGDTAGFIKHLALVHLKVIRRDDPGTTGIATFLHDPVKQRDTAGFRSDHNYRQPCR